MRLLTPDLHASLLANHRSHHAAREAGQREPDPVPLLRLFNPVGHANWLATEIDGDGVLFGLADLGFGCPEVGSFCLAEIEALHLPFGKRIERDPRFRATHGLSAYAAAARKAGSIVLASRLLDEAAQAVKARRRC